MLKPNEYVLNVYSTAGQNPSFSEETSKFNHIQVIPQYADDKATTSAWYNLSNKIGLDLESEESDSFGSRTSLLENIINNTVTHSTTHVTKSPRRSPQSPKISSKERHEGVIEKQDTKTSTAKLSLTNRTVRRRQTPTKMNTRKAVQSVHEIQSSLRRAPRRFKDKSIANSSESTGLSKESWIPLNVRMKMLRRNMAVAKINTESRRQYVLILSFSTYTTSKRESL